MARLRCPSYRKKTKKNYGRFPPRSGQDRISHMAWRRIARWTCGVAAVATLGLWLYSSVRLWSASFGPWGIGSDTSWPGTLSLSYGTPSTPGPFFYSSNYVPWERVGLLPRADFRTWPGSPTRRYIIWIPFWIPLSASLAGFFLLRPKRRSSHGCRSCDYDLTGNVSGVCPECGTLIESVEKAV